MKIAISIVTKEQPIKVLVLTGLDEMGKMCMKLTGMTPSQYQLKYHQAWNE